MFGKAALGLLVACVCVVLLPLRAPGAQGRAGSEALIVVRNAGDGPGVCAQLESLGGRVLVRLEDNIIWATVSDPAIAGVVAGPGVLVASSFQAAEALRADSDTLVAAIAREFSRAIGPGRAVGAGVAAQDPLINDGWPQGAVSMDDYLANLRVVGLDPSDAKVAPLLARPGEGGALLGNSDNMTGTVAVELIFVESNGTIDPNSYTWTGADENNVIAKTASGLAWWAARASERGQTVSFAIYSKTSADPNVQQGYEPILHPSVDAPLWVNAIMGKLGFSAGDHLARVTAFNTSLRGLYGTNRAYTAFVCYNPTGATAFTDGYSAWAYLGGPYTNLLQRSFSWPFDQVFTHETGHIFSACDEYYQAGYGGCMSCGLCSHGVNNSNCEYCNPASVSCMMKANTWDLCSFTPGQLGWGTVYGRPALPGWSGIALAGLLFVAGIFVFGKRRREPAT